MKFRSANLHTIIIVTKIKDSLKKEKERVNGFFIFMAMPSLKFMLCHCSRLFKSFKFGSGSRISGKNLVILEFKYLQNKKW